MNAREISPWTSLSPQSFAQAFLIAAVVLWHGNMHVGLAGEAQAAHQQRVYKTIDDRKLTLDIDLPPDWKPNDKRPAIVFFFGGGWTIGTPEQFQPQAGYFAKRGLVCCRADYRVRSKDGVTPAQCVEDAMSAMRWVRGHAAELGADPNRLAAAGGSAGGHLAACTFFVDNMSAPEDDQSISPKPNAMVLYNPPLDLVASRDAASSKFIRGMNDATLKQISPLLYDLTGTPPTLLIDGTQDRFYAQIRDFVRKGKSQGAQVEAYYAEGQPHGFFNKPPWLQKTTAEVDRFMCRLGWLSDEPTVPLPTRQAQPGSEKDKQ